MNRKNHNKLLFFFSFGSTLIISWTLFYFYSPVTLAADVNVSACVPKTEICNNSADDDCDSLVDCSDADCDGDSACGVCVPSAEICDNSIDDDCDDLVDCDDNDCTGHPHCSGSCFLAGTKIALADGTESTIENIKPGDLVLSYDEINNRLQPALVSRTFVHRASGYLLINNQLRVTANHPLYVNNQWRPAGQVKVGDQFFTLTGNPEIVSAVTEETGEVLVYNLAVDFNHNYFAENYLVHNKGGYPVCGNGLLEIMEACDNGAGNSDTQPNACRTNCQIAHCGDNVIDTGEECDDGNLVDGDGCSATCVITICGNGVVTGGEECDDGNTASGDGCSSACGREICGNGRIDFNEACDNGAGNSDTQPNACRTNCQIAHCSDNVIDTGEECDDGNIIVGDGCSATCQAEFGCGNGVVESGLGEECDDNNMVSGDCCSSSCQWELIIDPGVTESVSNTTATIGWEILCAPPGRTVTSQLEWGQTITVDEGLADGFTGLSGSYTILNLTRSTTYYYLISAQAGGATDIYPNSFRTLGGFEDCTNGLDDDSDGFCDYQASICTDGSVGGDQDCPCSPSFSCLATECVANRRTVSCVDQTVPRCQPDETRFESCGICPGVIIGTCQVLDEATCTVSYLANCCGNLICEPPVGESPVDCPVDCPVSCISVWECTAWQPDPCPESGLQTRNCYDQNACEIPINPPPTQQTCGGQCPGLTCGSCQQVNFNQCTCEELVPCCGNGRCETGETNKSCSQDCIEVCEPSWTCLGWSECANGIQQRECYDLNRCNLNIGRPPEVLSCDPNCEIACGLCQTINLAACRCEPITPCCGNRSCEESETGWSCRVDCSLPPNIRLTLTACLDGLDNDHDGLVDYPADPGCSKPSDQSELNFNEILNNLSALLTEKFLDNPIVEQANETFAAPAVVAVAIINTFATFSFFNLFSYLQYLYTQPFAVLFRRKRKKWGVVYNSLTKQAVDLAIVRLYQKGNGQLVQSRVTDKQGRYTFITPPGEYYLMVTKPKFDFPTALLKDKREDGKYLDLYHGETVMVTDKRIAVTANIPLDPKEDVRPATKIIFQYYLRKLQYAVSFSAVPVAAVSMVISPSAFTFTLFGFHCLLYILFRRLGYQRPPKSWGIVYDKGNSKPLAHAITRIFDKQYNKLLETRVADAKGRYAFLVDNNVYYLTADKGGYKTAKSFDIDLISKDKEAMVGMNIGLEKGVLAVTELITPSQPSVPSPSVTTPSAAVQPPAGKVGLPANLQPTEKPVQPVGPASVAPVVEPSKSIASSLETVEQRVEDVGVGRESLEELLKAKESVKEVKEDIAEEKEKIEELEEKAKTLEKNIEGKIEDKDFAQPADSESVKDQVPPPPIAEPLTAEAKKTESPEKSTGIQPPENSIFG